MEDKRSGIDLLLEMCRERKMSDLHLTVKLPPMGRSRGDLEPLPGLAAMSASMIENIANHMLGSLGRKYIVGEDEDFCYISSDGNRNRVNLYTQYKEPALAIRLLNDEIPTIEDLDLPEIFKAFALYPRGLMLVTGPTGSGKSTTLAAIVDHININKADHILTFEDPIEYKHENKKSMVNQREIGVDVESFSKALKSALREDPDVILVGEMRDPETTAAAITAAETGHYVLSSLHTTGAASTIDRIIDQFPGGQQEEMRSLLAQVLRVVITQTLLPKADGTGRVAAFEIMICNDAVSNLIRENKCHQIASVLQTGLRQGMQSLDYHIAQLVRTKVVTYDIGLSKCVDPAAFRKYIEA